MQRNGKGAGARPGPLDWKTELPYFRAQSKTLGIISVLLCTVKTRNAWRWFSLTLVNILRMAPAIPHLYNSKQESCNMGVSLEGSFSSAVGRAHAGRFIPFPVE